MHLVTNYFWKWLIGFSDLGWFIFNIFFFFNCKFFFFWKPWTTLLKFIFSKRKRKKKRKEKKKRKKEKKKTRKRKEKKEKEQDLEKKGKFISRNKETKKLKKNPVLFLLLLLPSSPSPVWKQDDWAVPSLESSSFSVYLSLFLP